MWPWLRASYRRGDASPPSRSTTWRVRPAENAIERLLSAGVPAIRIELIIGQAVQDARDAPIGTFAGTTTADAETVGSYGNIAHSGREAMGTFAGDAGKQRRGSYGDIDRDTVTTYQSGLKRTRIVSHNRLNKILVDPDWTRRPLRPMWTRCTQDTSSCWSKATPRWTTSRP